MATISYSRDNEKEADRKGIKMLIRSGISPAGMIRFFEKVQKHEKNPAPALAFFLRTHPLDSERIAYLKSLAEDAPEGKPLVVPWKEFKKRVHEAGRSNPAAPQSPTT